MKPKRPRTAGTGYSRDRNKSSDEGSPSFRKDDERNSESSSGRDYKKSTRSFKKPSGTGSRFTKSSGRGGFKKDFGNERSEKGRDGFSGDRNERGGYPKKSWGEKPYKKSGTRSFGGREKPERFDDRKKTYSRTDDRPGDRKFEKREDGTASRRNFSKDGFQRREKPEGFSRERKPYSSERPFRSDKPKRDYKPSGEGWKKRDEPRGRSEGENYSGSKWSRKEKHTFYGDKKRFSKNRFEKNETPDDGSTRLNKYISNAGICSRREADDMIKAGVISVNGKVITEMGFKVNAGDEVRYNNETLRSEKLVYVLLNKPKDFITTSDDPDNRKTVMSLVSDACKERIYPVGRLDRNTTGLLLFTNDGELARKLTHPSFEVQKIYQVDLDKNLKPYDMDKISEGFNLEDGFVKVDAISYVGIGNDKSVVGVELHSGKNLIVRRMFEALDYKVKKLDRVYFAGLSKKDLPRGRWRFLAELEVASLKMMTGDKKFKNFPEVKKDYATVD